MKVLDSGTDHMFKISLAVKWCPSLDSSLDKTTLLCETIGRKVIPKEEYPEVYIGDNDWGSIPYHRVDFAAMKMYKHKFLKHDKERFQEYLNKVKTGAMNAASALLPHEIVAALGDKDDGEVAELQWKRMVDDMAEKGKLNNYLAICDVFRSMKVSVALDRRFGI